MDRLKGRDGLPVFREVVEHPGAAVILPLLPDGRILLVRQYRHAIKRWTWELPAGTLKKGESALACAKRELEEETGWRAKRWSRLIEYYPSPGILSERMSIFKASGLMPGTPQCDADEEIRILKVTLREAERWIRRGRVCDGKSMIGLWAFKNK